MEKSNVSLSMDSRMPGHRKGLGNGLATPNLKNALRTVRHTLSLINFITVEV